jgi:D-alanine transaminase
MRQLASVNGEILDAADARVSMEDRGNLFGDGIYEVIRVYNGRPFTLQEHFDRLERSARAIRIPVDREAVERDALALIGRQELREGSLYLQITRGAGPRSHAFAPDLVPQITMKLSPAARPPEAVRTVGVGAITVPDDRWARCYVKSLNLLSNVLAKQDAVEAGCAEAIYVRDGFITEGASSNVYVVLDGGLCTAPLSNYILGGITRQVVLQEARRDGIPVREEPVRLADLWRASEAMVSSTVAEIQPVVKVDGRPIGSGLPGPMYRRLAELFEARIDAECGAAATR